MDQQYPQLGEVKLEERDGLDEYELAKHEAIAKPHEKQYLNEIVRVLRVQSMTLGSIQFLLLVVVAILVYFLLKDIYRMFV